MGYGRVFRSSAGFSSPDYELLSYKLGKVLMVSVAEVNKWCTLMKLEMFDYLYYAVQECYVAQVKKSQQYLHTTYSCYIMWQKCARMVSMDFT